jgi:O-antigen ligase
MSSRISPWLLPAACIGIGMFAAYASTALVELPARYLVFALIGGLGAAVVALVPDKRRFFLGVFILSLQLDAAMYFMYRGGARAAGWSGPPGIELPLSFIPAMCLLVIAAATRPQSQRWDWGGSVGYASMAIIATVALSIVPSTERFLTACSVLRATQLLLVLLAVVNGVRDRTDIDLVLRLLTLMLIAQSIVYLIETALGATFGLTGDVIPQHGEIQRHGGTVGVTPAAYGSFLHPLVQIALAQFLFRGHKRVKWYGLALGLGVLTMLMTYTRAAWVGMALGAVVVVVVGANRRLIATRRLAVPLVLGACALAITLPKMALRLAGNASDADERFALMRMAMQVIGAHPIFGIGAGAYTFIFGNYLSAGQEDNWLYVVHNAYLLRWAETGIFGLVALVAFFVYALRDSARVTRSTDLQLAIYGVGFGAGLVAQMWEMWWDVWGGFTYTALMWTLCGLTVAVLRIDSAKQEQTEPLPALRPARAA